MPERFADSFVFFAALNRNDRQHHQAVSALSNSSDRLVTTSWVLTELADGFSAPHARNRFVALEQSLRENPRVVIVPAEENLFQAGLQLYKARPDKNWSLTDRISFIVMRQRGIVEALTGDHHFEQAGFIRLIRD